MDLELRRLTPRSFTKWQANQQEGPVGLGHIDHGCPSSIFKIERVRLRANRWPKRGWANSTKTEPARRSSRGHPERSEQLRAKARAHCTFEMRSGQFTRIGLPHWRRESTTHDANRHQTGAWANPEQGVIRVVRIGECRVHHRHERNPNRRLKQRLLHHQI